MTCLGLKSKNVENSPEKFNRKNNLIMVFPVQNRVLRLILFCNLFVNSFEAESPRSNSGCQSNYTLLQIFQLGLKVSPKLFL